MSADVRAKRFRVAFSFAGEKRDFVEKVARILAGCFSEDKILYDKFHKAEFARPRLGRSLPKLYHDESDLVVVVVCRDYVRKDWPGLEWDAVFDLVRKREDDTVMLCRFDGVEVEGILSDAGFLELDRMTPEQAASLILERLALNEGKPKDYYKKTKPNGNGPKVLRPRPWVVTATAIAAIVLTLAVLVGIILDASPFRRSSVKHPPLPPPLLHRQYFPYAGETLRTNAQALGDGTELRDTGGTSLLITRRPGTELFYGLTLTVQPGGDDSWQRYLADEGEVEVEFSPSRDDQVLILKAEFVGGSDQPSWIFGEAALERRSGEPSRTASHVVRRVAVRTLLGHEPERYGYRVNRLTIEERLLKEPIDRASFELHRIVLRAKPTPPSL